MNKSIKHALRCLIKDKKGSQVPRIPEMRASEGINNAHFSGHTRHRTLRYPGHTIRSVKELAHCGTGRARAESILLEEAVMKYYHGADRNNAYFEGWYLKYQTKDGKALALIPALHIGSTGRRSISLQILTDSASWWLEYPETEFQASQRRFYIRVGQNTFCDQETRLHVEHEGLSIHGTLYHGRFAPLASDIMGPFRFFSGMECSHGIISMGHLLNGTLNLNGEILDFSDGIGYVETDRGRSFPDAYLWTQCTWREPERSSLMLSIATIPLPIGHFTGCICAVIHNGREYRLATYRGARIEQWSNTGAIICQGKYRLTAEVLEERGSPLRAPVEGTMGRTVHESLRAKLRYRLWKGRELLFEHTDSSASFEYADQRSTVNR